MMQHWNGIAWHLVMHVALLGLPPESALAQSGFRSSGAESPVAMALGERSTIRDIRKIRRTR